MRTKIKKLKSIVAEKTLELLSGENKDNLYNRLLREDIDLAIKGIETLKR